MKKITNIGLAALVAMGMLGTSCNKVESQEMETPKDNIVTLTTTVGFTADDTKALAIDYTAKTLTKTFAVGEQVVLTYEDQDGNNQNTVSQALTPEDISADGKSAKLTFTLTNPKENGYIAYQYPASESSIYTQNGTLTDVATRDYAAYDGSFAGTNLPTSVTLDNEIAVVAFTLYKSDGTTDITNTITGMTIEVSGVTYTITPSGLDKIYVAMWPKDGAEITITATDGSKNYTKTLTGKTYEAGEFYQQGLKMAEAAPAYKLLSAATAEDIGKVVCAAGHLHTAKTAVPAGCTAVGILGKVTETGCGLILALQDATAQTWNTINGWTSVTTYAGTTLKVLPDAAAHGSLTSYAALGTTAVSDWAVAQKSDYEAIFTNLGSTTGDSDGKTYDANVNAYITTGVGGTAISGYCWSTTVDDWSGKAWTFYSNFWRADYKTTSNRVRPVLGFGPAKLLSAATTSDVGKVVCADGHLRDAKTAVPAGGTAVGILGKVTETGHGLILALQDASNQTWTTINGWTSTTDYASTTLKVLPDDARGSLTGYTALGATAVSNWAVAQKSDYEAIFINLGSTTGNSNGTTYDGNVNAYITTGVGGTAMSDSYWSATEFDGGNALAFTHVFWGYSEKTNSLSVRPVLGF